MNAELKEVVRKNVTKYSSTIATLIAAQINKKYI